MAIKIAHHSSTLSQLITTLQAQVSRRFYRLAGPADLSFSRMGMCLCAILSFNWHFQLKSSATAPPKLAKWQEQPVLLLNYENQGNFAEQMERSYEGV